MLYLNEYAIVVYINILDVDQIYFTIVSFDCDRIFQIQLCKISFFFMFFVFVQELYVLN